MRIFPELSPEEQEHIERMSRDLKIMVREFRRGHIHRNETKAALIDRVQIIKKMADAIEASLRK